MAEGEFSITEEQGEFNAWPQSARKPRSTAILETVAAMEAIRTRAPLEMARRQVNTLNEAVAQAEARGRVAHLVNADFENKLNQAIETTSLPDVHEAERERLKGVKFAQATDSPEAYALARDHGGNLLQHLEARALSRQRTLAKIIDERISDEDVGVASVIGDILDIIVSAPIDALRLGGFDRTDLAQKMHGLMTADITEEEFENEAKAVLEEMADAGILQDSNFLFLMSGAQNLEELGEGIEGTLEKFATVADLVTLGGFAGSKALRGASMARSTTAIVSGSAGPEAAEQVLRGAVASPGTTAATNADVIRHTQPAFNRMPESFNGQTRWVAPGSKIAKEVETENTFFDIVRNATFSDRIDPQVLSEWAPQGLKILSERIDARSYDNVLELNVEPDELGNLFGRVTYGRSDGLPFGSGRANTRTSKASAQKLANSLNGRIVGTDVDLPQAAERATQLAKNQRRGPETSMIRVQEAMGGGVLSPVVERAGDTLHRMFQFANRGEFMHEDALEKIEVVVRRLNNRFGFEKEMAQNMRSNAEARGISLAEQEGRVNKALRGYTNAYKELRKGAFNPLQKLIIDGNIAIGEQRWKDARRIWGEINETVSDKAKFDKAVKDLGDIKPEKRVIDPGTGEAVVRTIDRGGREYYVVDVLKPIPTEGLARELSNDEIGTGFLRAFGSTWQTTPTRLQELALRGEGVSARVRKQLERELNKTLKPIKGTNEEVFLEKIFYDLRDGKLSHMRRPLNKAEFESEWARYSEARPSEAAFAAYQSVQKFNDMQYLLKADEMYKRTVNSGYDEVVSFRIARQDGDVEDFDLVAKRTTPANVDDEAINPITGVHYDAENIPEGSKVFEVLNYYKTGDRHAKYVVFDEPKVRRLYHSDVLGYNPGGPRGYEFTNHFVKQEGGVTLLSGRTGSSLPKTILGTATRKEAELAVEQINNILKFVGDKVPGLQGMTTAQAISAMGELGSELSEVLVRNNTWNPNLETVDAFIEFMRKYGLHPGKNVGTAMDSQPLAIADDAGQLRFSEKTYGEVFTSRLNNPRNSTRRDEPIMGFGGARAVTRSPLDMIQNDFMRVMHSQALSAYNFQAVNGWLKGAKAHILNNEQIAGAQPLRAMREAKVADTPQGRNYQAARNAIERTLGTRAESERKWNAMMGRTAEWIWDKGFVKIDPETGGRSPGKLIRALQASSDPFMFLRGISFDARLGMFSPDQMIVQSSQFVNIAAIVGPQRWPEALQAAATHWPVRAAVHTLNQHGPEGAINNLRAIGRRTSTFTGMSEDEFVEFATWVWESGRLEVGTEVAELSQQSMSLTRNMFGKIRRNSRFFFNEGEKFPRSAAIRVAWNEYRKTFPNADMNTNHARNWIARRNDALTAAMTRSSAATWQQGPLSVPLQFMSYITRMFESLFTNRILTKAERKRLGLAQLFFWGAAGTGAGSLFDAYVLENGYNIDSTTYTALRYGLLDAIVQSVTGSEAVIGGRLAPAEGIQQLIDNWRDQNFFETAVGPAGALITDSGQALVKGMMDAMTGNFSMVESDMTEFVRHISVFDDATKAWIVYNTGDYLSRNGDKVIEGLTGTDALLVGLGWQLEDVNLQYSRLEVLRNQNDHVKEVTKRIKEYVREHNEAILNDDLEKAQNIQKLIATLMGTSPVWAQEDMQRALAGDFGTMADRTFMTALKRGHGMVNLKTETDTTNIGEDR